MYRDTKCGMSIVVQNLTRKRFCCRWASSNDPMMLITEKKESQQIINLFSQRSCDLMYVPYISHCNHSIIYWPIVLFDYSINSYKQYTGCHLIDWHDFTSSLAKWFFSSMPFINNVLISKILPDSCKHSAFSVMSHRLKLSSKTYFNSSKFRIKLCRCQEY